MAEAQGAFERNLAAGEVLFKEGDKGEEMYLIKSGKVEISNNAGGVKKVLAELSEGSFLGEMAIVDDAPRSAAATALSEVSLLILDRAAFKAQLQENPMVEYLISSLVKRLRETNEQVKILLQKDDVCRVAASLLAMGREKGAPDGSGVFIKGSYTPGGAGQTGGGQHPQGQGYPGEDAGLVADSLLRRGDKDTLHAGPGGILALRHAQGEVQRGLERATETQKHRVI